MVKRFWRWLKPFFKPAPKSGARPKADSQAGQYVRSFLFLRFTIGLLGVTLPVALVVLDWTIFHAHPGTHDPRGSMSQYYYSGFREVFTVTLGTIAFFLFAYKFTEKNLDNLLSIFAGLAGMLIPLFPTGIPGDIDPPPKLTPIQHGIDHRFGLGTTQSIHYGATISFLLFLGGICILFGLREGERLPHGNWIPTRVWGIFHLVCAGLIGLAGLWILAIIHINHLGPIHDFGPLIHGPYQSVLFGEVLATMAFGASWLAKGAEINYLFFGRDEPVRFRLETVDGRPAEPAQMTSAVPSPGDTIPLGARMLRVLEVRDGEPPVLVVEDVAG
jgi:hypothetical protein